MEFQNLKILVMGSLLFKMLVLGGTTYPQAVYNLKSDATASNTNDLFKAFINYTIFSDGMRDRNGTLMNWSQLVAC